MDRINLQRIKHQPSMKCAMPISILHSLIQKKRAMALPRDFNDGMPHSETFYFNTMLNKNPSLMTLLMFCPENNAQLHSQKDYTMKIRIVFLLLLLCCSLQSRGQYVIPGAEQQPAWVFPLYFEDDIGSRDTVYIGYDPQSISGGGWPFYHDTIFGERYIPYDTIGFLTYLDVNPWWFESDSILKVIVTSELNQANIQLRDCKLPLTMRWSSQKFYDDTLPFPDNSPLPRIEIVLWPSDLSTTGNGFGDNCGFTEPIMLSDTSSSSYECTFSDSIVLDSWGCPGCLFSGDFRFSVSFLDWRMGWRGGSTSLRADSCLSESNV